MTNERSALLVVDLQNDFCPGGALAVAEGDRVVDILNGLMPRFPTVVATQDWHPENHVSFAARGGEWPVHCVASTPGAAFHPQLEQGDIDLVIRKATEPEQEAYSGFDGTELAARLRDRGVSRVFVGGLALDYCVDATARDARDAGFDTYVITDATRPVFPENAAAKEAGWRAAGIKTATSDELQATRDARG
jgi:nicotinamidase/pyrazinamidase